MGNVLLVDDVRLDTDASTSLAPEPDVASPRDRSAPRRRFGVHRLLPTAYRLLRAIASAAEWLFGLVSLVLGLSMLAALPLVQFASLGYFLESSARWRELAVARWFHRREAGGALAALR